MAMVPVVIVIVRVMFGGHRVLDLTRGASSGRKTPKKALARASRRH
jgi:hypothetical protein